MGFPVTDRGADSKAATLHRVRSTVQREKGGVPDSGNAARLRHRDPRLAFDRPLQ
jgi:hypothetical protein